jgi:hypothetical protein
MDEPSNRFEVLQTEEELWTVGFRRPGTGTWEPICDHDSEEEADEQVKLLNGVVQWPILYMRTEPGLWTTGSFDLGGRWEPIDDHGTWYAAEAQVVEMNAGN